LNAIERLLRRRAVELTMWGWIRRDEFYATGKEDVIVTIGLRIW